MPVSRRIKERVCLYDVYLYAEPAGIRSLPEGVLTRLRLGTAGHIIDDTGDTHTDLRISIVYSELVWILH